MMSIRLELFVVCTYDVQHIFSTKIFLNFLPIGEVRFGLLKHCLSYSSCKSDNSALNDLI